MNKRLVLPVLLLCSLWFTSAAQEKFYTKTGRISFTSNAPLEDIVAVNKTAGALLDTRSGHLQFAVLMKGFEFRKALMQEHFNENYVESDKYPKAEFRGNILNNAEVNYGRDGSHPVNVRGQLTLHGVTKEITVPATLTVQGGKIEASSRFSVLLSDYRISIPSVVKDKINNNVKITVDVRLDPLKQ